MSSAEVYDPAEQKEGEVQPGVENYKTPYPKLDKPTVQSNDENRVWIPYTHVLLFLFSMQF